MRLRWAPISTATETQRSPEWRASKRPDPEEVTFVANPRYSALARTTNAGAVLVTLDFPEIQTPTLRTANPYLAFAKAVQIFYREPVYSPGIHTTAVVHPTARVGREAHIGAFAVVSEGVTIGDHATLLPHVVIYPYASVGDNFYAHAHSVVREYCRIGDNVVLQNGVIVGCDGFGFAKDDAGIWHKIVQSGPPSSKTTWRSRPIRQLTVQAWERHALARE